MSPLTLTDRGLQSCHDAKLSDALAYLGHAHRISPNYPEVYLVRGQVRSRANDIAGAIADLRASARLSPKNPLPLQMLANVYRQAGQADLAGAAQAQAAALGP